MSTQLAKLIDKVVTKEGITGRLRLASAIERGERMVERYRKDLSTPTFEIAYKLAIECGCDDATASQIAKDTVLGTKGPTKLRPSKVS